MSILDQPLSSIGRTKRPTTCRAGRGGGGIWWTPLVRKKVSFLVASLSSSKVVATGMWSPKARSTTSACRALRLRVTA